VAGKRGGNADNGEIAVENGCLGRCGENSYIAVEDAWMCGGFEGYWFPDWPDHLRMGVCGGCHFEIQII